jgi:sugar phosphate isomerase/epimerase
MKLAIQEDMLPGRSMTEKFEHARDLGFEGIEVWGRDLGAKIPALIEAMERTGLQIAAVNHGRQGRILDAQPLERERALTELRASIMDAVDIGAQGVIFVPAFFGYLLPDLSPYRTAAELQADLLVEHLRTLEDYANAMGVTLYIEPINRYETSFINRLEQAAEIVKRRNNHPRLKLCADVFHMMLEESTPAAAVRAHAEMIGHVHLADSNRRLPGQGATDFVALASALREIDYDGWCALECGDPGANAVRADDYLRDLPASIAHLRASGFSNT